MIRLQRFMAPLARLGLMVVLFHGFSARAEAQALALSAEQWRADLAFLERRIREKHVAPWEHLSRDSLTVLVQALAADLPALPGYAVAVRLAGVAAAIGDGHTSVLPWPLQRRTAVRFHWYGDTLRLVAVPAEHRALLGSRLVAVGATPLPTALSRLNGLVPQHESPTFVWNWTQSLLRHSEVLATLGVIESIDSVVYSLVDDSGRPSLLTLAALPPGEAEPALIRPGEATPFSRSRPGDALWFGRLDAGKVMYLNFSEYPSKARMRAFADSLAESLDTDGVESLLVDLRNNGGGDLTKGQLLIERIRAVVVRRGIRVFVAIGRGTYSAAVANAMHFKEALAARLIGEVSAGRPNGSQENGFFNLPNSRLRGSVSIRGYKFAPNDTPGLIPDVPISATWKDHQEGVDPVLSWVVAAARG